MESNHRVMIRGLDRIIPPGMDPEEIEDILRLHGR